MSYGTSTAPPAQAHDGLQSTSGDGNGRSNDPVAGTQSTQTLTAKLRAFYDRNFGLFLVLMAQVFGSLMTMTTRLLETGFTTKFHALQIIFVRMLITAVFGLLYMWYKSVPYAPFGDRRVRRLLVLRGSAGFVGLSGAYYALSYLNISDATVISFLTPILTAFICFIALREPFTPTEALAGFIALGGVLLIARPSFLFPTHDRDPLDNHSFDRGGIVPTVPASPAQRSLAVLSAAMGAFGAATAYSTIRVIGRRAHSLISVNYFAMIASAVSFVIIMVHPELHFEIPQSAIQWILLLAIGISGFLLQFLLTEGLQREKGGRAANLIYTQLVFAIILEKLVWGTTPSGWSLGGGGLIIFGAILSSLQKAKPPVAEPKKPAADEESRLLSGDETSRTDTRDGLRS